MTSEIASAARQAMSNRGAVTLLSSGTLSPQLASGHATPTPTRTATLRRPADVRGNATLAAVDAVAAARTTSCTVSFV
jgi:hypothetical protein